MFDEKNSQSPKVTSIEKGFGLTKEKILADINQYKEEEKYLRQTHDFAAAEDRAAMIKAAQEELEKLEENQNTMKGFKEEKKESE